MARGLVAVRAKEVVVASAEVAWHEVVWGQGDSAYVLIAAPR